jgi:hypothetical protein
MRIGLDFDNTIIRYDDVFRTTAEAQGLVPTGFAGTKQQVRDAIRLLPDGEVKWQVLQGYVYGKGITAAQAFPGVETFLQRARERGDTVLIVSHKTRFGHYDPDRVDLREAALGWMATQRFFKADDPRVERANVYFLSTRAEKLQRIGELGCDVFVDDLSEVLDDPGFPLGVRRILFSQQAAVAPASYPVCADWPSIEETILACG